MPGQPARSFLVRALPRITRVRFVGLSIYQNDPLACKCASGSRPDRPALEASLTDRSVPRTVRADVIWSLFFLASASSAAILPTVPSSAQLQRYEFAQIEMGTVFSIILYTPTEVEAQQASAAAFRRIEGLDSLLSDYKRHSELNRVCREAAVSAQIVSSDLFYVLQKSVEFSERTGGAFDVTVKPLVDLWKEAFRDSRRPEEDRIRRALSRVGHSQILLNPRTRSVRFRHPGVTLDLGAIAKGYAADEVVKLLRSREIETVLIDAGGDVRAGRAPPGSEGWRIEVEGAGREVPLILVDQAIATSGDLHNFAEIGGVRYSHIIDPRSGQALEESRQVTVVAPDALSADALATAFSVLSPRRVGEITAGLPGVSVTMRWPDGRVWTSNEPNAFQRIRGRSR